MSWSEKTFVAWTTCLFGCVLYFVAPSVLAWDWSVVAAWVQAAGSLIALWVAVSIARRSEAKADESRAKEGAQLARSFFAVYKGCTRSLAEASEAADVGKLVGARETLREAMVIGRTVPLHHLNQEALSCVIALRTQGAGLLAWLDTLNFNGLNNWGHIGSTIRGHRDQAQKDLEGFLVLD